MSAMGGTHQAMHRSVTTAATRSGLEQALLACGIGYGLGYVIVNDVLAAGMWDHYSRVDQAISELSSTGSPSKGFLTAMLPVFTVLVVAFGAGVWRAAGESRALRLTAGILIAQGLMFPLWLLFPMSSRDEIARTGGGANDVGHLVLSALAILFILAETGFSAAALGKGFRYFATTMAITVVAAGAYVATTTSDVAAGDPTPWMGFVERISYGAWLLWMAVLAGVLLRRTRTRRATSGTTILRPRPAVDHANPSTPKNAFPPAGERAGMDGVRRGGRREAGWKRSQVGSPAGAEAGGTHSSPWFVARHPQPPSVPYGAPN